MNEGSMRPTDLALAYLAAAVVVASVAAATALIGIIVDWGSSTWAAIHLVLLGGVSLLILGVSQFFVTAFLATSPPSRRMVAAQITCWTAGAACVVTGVSTDADWLATIGVVLLLTTLLLYARSLAGLHSRSLQRAPWASRWYAASALWLVLGIAVGLMLTVHFAWSHGSLLGAHLAFNLGGWLGGAIVGTLHTFAPSLTQTRLRFPRLQPATFAFWSAGCGVTAIGYAFSLGALVLLGWSLLVVGAGLLATNLIASGSESKVPLTLPARLVIWSQAFLPLGLLFGLVSAADHSLAPLFGDDRVTLAVLLLAGWVGLTVIGSMLHLLSVVVRVRDLGRPATTPNQLQDRLLASAAVGAIGLLAVAEAVTGDRLVGLASFLVLLVAVILVGLVIRSVVEALLLGPPGRHG